ncbi:hypothetical protein [Chlamydia psittaci]|uniref:hypothetical protein n=1 Tax=Chlamydia psittaci TaxID=83554 RepID=UPI00027E1399|nr:hypothetical protein [Chlamydia psittaci]EPJ24616.1 hypothetical protein CP09DC77_1045 [Chlamydia psittaci 09DC77]EPJ29579.1 hypothetical protein CP09DC78_1035 [Chlamydia psittaci 09DC78]EPL00995.1 hypothetical protein CP09DC79_0756 [Chlamydia psittaci 09DC79]AFS21836.1 hypothetical protein B599_0624 [Chlamydia psittaci MN]AFS27067.1 hypothetical protein B711_0669 [Chlamydia psittaci CP3]
MFVTYPTHASFIEGTRNHPHLLKSAYVRTQTPSSAQISEPTGVSSHLECWVLIDKENLKSTILNSIPILGTIRGLARLYSIYSVKDRSCDATANTVMHTTTGILETLGLGIFIILAKIVAFILLQIVYFVGVKTGLIRDQNTQQ